MTEIRFQHDPEEPIGIVRKVTTSEGGLHFEIDVNGESRLLSDEMAEKLYAATIRPFSFGWQLEYPLLGHGLAYWQKRERWALGEASLRRSIPRALRWRFWDTRRRLAGWIYPEAFYDDDD